MSGDSILTTDDAAPPAFTRKRLSRCVVARDKILALFEKYHDDCIKSADSILTTDDAAPPAFTRTRDSSYAVARDRILAHFEKYHDADLKGIKRLIWVRSTPEDDHVWMEFLTAVELHPSLHVKDNLSPKLRKLYKYNAAR
jgi:hypothetical protein